MRKILFALLVTTFANAAHAEDDPVVAIWAEDSGSLPPEYAWDYTVRFLASGMVEVEYCKGYSEEAPGCATVRKALGDDAQDAIEAEIEPYVQDLTDSPPARASDDNIPIGGGSIGGWILVADTKVVLPNFPAERDSQRVTEVLGVLQKYTPKNLVKKAERRAKQP